MAQRFRDLIQTSFFLRLLVLAVFIILLIVAAQGSKPSKLALGEYSIPILGYHGLGDQSATAYYIYPENFTKQMQWLKDNGYHVISMDKLFDGLNGKTKLPFKPVVITFDDGNITNYTIAYPILKKFHYPATFFVISGVTGSDPDRMNWEQVKEMAKHGMTIGSHTVNHDNLAKMKLGPARAEIIDSKKAIEDKLGVEVKYFSYPNGGYKNRDMEVKDAGYVAAFTTHRSITQKIISPDSLYALSRYEVLGDLPIPFEEIFQQKLDLSN